MDEKQSQFRPPIITIMGHVDHGKTTLLDAIRKSSVASGEHGGITQHIGAYQVEFEGHLITFVDTPGHAAFEQMRSRGAEVADIVILVVAANDSVKPQTIEAIKHIKKSQKPIIVAITKVDLPDISIEKVKGELQKYEVAVEGQGGDVPVVEVAATKGKGISELLEVINLSWQLNPQPSLASDPLEAVVVESFLDRGRGAVVTVIVEKGTLKVGQKIVVDNDTINVRALVDDAGKNIKEAGPSKPVEILGFKKALEVGSIVRDTNITAVKEKGPVDYAEIIAHAQEVKDKFKIILKADVLGSLEAILNNLPEKVLVVASSVGEVSQTDISFAKVASAPILAFNIKVSNQLKIQAEREGVVVKEYRIIYELLEDMEAVSEGFEAAKLQAKVKGRAKITQIFEIEGKKIAGCVVTMGKLNVGETIFVKKNEDDPGIETKIASIKRFKKDVPSISNGQECGIAMASSIDFEAGNVIESLG
ncbi:translation initiation factor IF-2 [Candidatus Curtissbacteria bacterium]|nr:translation initiation factor IF-2 [Candidatus Curtissbacteria bacterium]